MRGSAFRNFLGFACIAAAALHAAAQTEPGTSVATFVEEPPSGHVEVALSGSAGANPDDGAMARYLPLLREPGFLDLPAVATADPLAPCALVPAALAANLLNRMFFGLIRPGGFDFKPPRGTNILGMYDVELARGVIPRDDPAKAADMLARSIVWRSWGLSSMLNALMIGKAPRQKQCLEFLTRPERNASMLSDVKPADVVDSHAAPVAAYFLSVDNRQGHLWLSALLSPGRMQEPAAAAGNPLAPCSLLGALRMAARLNESWGAALGAGKFAIGESSQLAPYAEALKKGLGNAPADVDAAEVLAAVFDAEIRRSNWLTGQLTAQATQGECLDELFQPGALRQKLLGEGKVLPMR